MNYSDKTEEQIQEILYRWLESQDRGAAATPESLCADCPHLTATVRERIEWLEAMERGGARVSRDHVTSLTASRKLRGKLRPPAAAGEIGTLGPYRIVRELGHGGMGVVYLASDQRTGKKTALKVMLPKYDGDFEAKKRFIRESRAAARINSPHVVAIYEADEIDGMPFISMEYLEGHSLEGYLRSRATLPLEEILRIGREAAAGLAEAHRLGLVHRDIKPENLWIEAPTGRVKLLDFGIAKMMDGGASTEITAAGSLLGTPSYMSPEQALARKDINYRTDLFSLGVVLYRLCTGQLPFQGDSPTAILIALSTEEPTSIRQLNPAIPEPLAVFIHHLLAKKPDQRPESADTVAAELARIESAYVVAEPVVADRTEAKPAFMLHKQGYEIKDHTFIEKIGEGSFGEVWKAERDGIMVALKILKKSLNSEDTKRVLRSLEALKRLHHKYLLHTENFWADGDQLYIEMELADGGSLKERLKVCRTNGAPGIPDDELLKYFTQTAQALDYLHSHRPVFLHRDIKPGNILLVQGNAKIADFDLLRQVSGEESGTQTQGGTPAYMAPESILQDKFSVATDLWSFAVTYIELRQGKLPFTGTQHKMAQKIIDAAPELSDVFYPDEKKVLLRALDKDPRNRFATCGDFVRALNQAVPWNVAKDDSKTDPIGKSPAAQRRDPPTPEPKPTPFVSGQTDPVAKPAPDADVALVDNDPSRGSSTVPNDHRTSVKPSKPPVPDPDRKTPKETSAASTGHGKKDEGRATVIPPAPVETYVAPTPGGGGRTLQRIAATLLVIALGVGACVVAHFVAKAQVEELVAAGNYPAALDAIADRAWLLPNSEELKKDVVERWWAKVKPADNEKDIAAVGKQIDAVNGFLRQFPDHPEAKAWRARAGKYVYKVLIGSFDDRLRQRLFGAARELIRQHEKKLTPADVIALHTRVDGHQAAVDILVEAKKKLDLKEFDECVQWLDKKEVVFLFAEDSKQRDSLKEQAKKAKEDRDRRDAEIRSRLDKAIAAKDPVVMRKSLRELVTFRDSFPKNTPWQPPVQILQTRILDSLLERAWSPLHGDKVQVADATQQVEAMKEFLSEQAKLAFTPAEAQTKNLAAIEAIAATHTMAKKAEWQAQFANVMTSLKGAQGLDDPLRNKIWKALAKLDRKFMEFSHVAQLDIARPTEESVDVNRWHSQIAAEVLQRLVEKEQWLPKNEKTKEMFLTLSWCKRVENPNDWIKALTVECLIEREGKLDGAPATGPWSGAGW
ncbi:MAG: protein kinase, partial [Planctomycetes bacterium]|nr:protein kinase [Planctomycetota bacterium]